MNSSVQTEASAEASAEALITAALDRIPAPAQAVALIHQGRLIYVQEAGDATTQSVFRLGTLSHALTAYAAYHVLNKHLHTPINDLLKNLRVDAPDGGTITPHHLLTHTAGLGTARSLWALVRNDTLHKAGTRTPHLATHYNGVLKGQVAPGEKWCFSNDGYAVLGQAIAEVSGQPYPDAMQAHVFTPLKMHNATFNAPTLTGYKHNGRTPAPPMDAALLPALGVCASLDDLVAFVAAIFEADVFSTPHFQLDSRLPGMAYGLRAQKINGQRIAWLNGQIPGFSSALCIAPQTQTAAILLANAPTDGALSALARRAVLTLMNADVAPIAPDEAPSAPVTTDFRGYYAPSPGLLTNIEVWGAYGGGLSVRRSKNAWVIRGQMNPAESHPLQATDDAHAFTIGASAHAPLIVFQPGTDGHAARLEIGLFALHRRAWHNSLGARLMMAVLVLFLLFGLIVGIMVS